MREGEKQDIGYFIDRLREFESEFYEDSNYHGKCSKRRFNTLEEDRYHKELRIYSYAKGEQLGKIIKILESVLK